jgi:phage-related protein
MSESGEWSVLYYVNARGDSPPLEYIKGLKKEDRAKVARTIELLKQLGVKIGRPQARHLEGKLWELRPSPHRLIYFAYTRRRFVILHAFQKQTRKTPRAEIEIARRRMRRVLEEEGQ